MINEREFCALATARPFSDWLKEHDNEIWKDLRAHLQQGLGCKANTKKMKEIFELLKKDEDKYKLLDEWVDNTYPGIKNKRRVIPGNSTIADASDNGYDDDDIRISGKRKDELGVFGQYDPSLNTIPRRLVISFLDAAKNNMDLNSMVAKFCIQQAYCDHFTAGDNAYIEYIPPELEHVIDDIPDKNWKLPAYRRKHMKQQGTE